MIDVHVLTMPDTPEEWVRLRRETLEAAVEAAGYPVHIHEVAGIPGHIGRARAEGYARGSAPYVTYVDDDDWVDPQIFAVLEPHLDGSTDAIFTHEVVHGDDGSQRISEAWHHLCVYRRPLLEAISFDELTWAVDIHCRNEAAGRIVKEVREPLYHYRAHGRSAPLRESQPEERNPRPFDAEALPASYWRSL